MFFNVFTVLTLMFLLGYWSMAQKIGISAGLNISSVYIQQSETPNMLYEDYHSIVNPNLSANYEFPLMQNLGLRLDFGYTGMGFGYKNENSNIYTVGADEFTEYSKIESMVRLSYLQFIPTLKYNINIGSKTNLYAMLGPYCSFAIYGNSKTSQLYVYNDPFSSNDLSQTNNETIEFGPNGDGISYFDFGFTPGFGCTLDKFYLEASYVLGLKNIDLSNDPDFRVLNRTPSLKLGYLFL